MYLGVGAVIFLICCIKMSHADWLCHYLLKLYEKKQSECTDNHVVICMYIDHIHIDTERDKSKMLIQHQTVTQVIITPQKTSSCQQQGKAIQAAKVTQTLCSCRWHLLVPQSPQ